MRQLVTLPPASEILFPTGEAAGDRRLTEMVLAAFVRAYAAGALDLSAVLRHALEVAEPISTGRSGAMCPSHALRQADLWVEFVDARDEYRRVAARRPPDAGDVRTAEQAVLQAYRRWSDA